MKCALCGAEWVSFRENEEYIHPMNECVLSCVLTDDCEAINAAIEVAKVDKNVFVAGMEFGYRHGTGENVVKQCWGRYQQSIK